MSHCTRARRHVVRAVRILLVVVAVLLALVGVPTLASSAPAPTPPPSDLGSLLYWYPGLSIPRGVIRWPDYAGDGRLHTAAVFQLSLGLSQTDKTRAPASGEDFYLRFEFDHGPGVLSSFRAAPQLQLPAGLTRADRRLPVRCAGKLSTSLPQREYVGGCGLAGSSSAFTIVSRAGVGAAPAFEMTSNTHWIWDIPVHASRPFNMTTLRASMWANEAGVYGSTTSISPVVFAGDPTSPIWKQYVAAPRQPSRGVMLPSWGLPDGPEQAVPWSAPRGPSDPIGTMQDFGTLEGVTTTVTSSPVYGVHPVKGEIRSVWLQHQAALGPAQDDAHWISGRLYRQKFAGGFIWYDDLREQTVLGGIYCWEVNDMRC